MPTIFPPPARSRVSSVCGQPPPSPASSWASIHSWLLGTVQCLDHQHPGCWLRALSGSSPVGPPGRVEAFTPLPSLGGAGAGGEWGGPGKVRGIRSCTASSARVREALRAFEGDTLSSDLYVREFIPACGHSISARGR